MSVSPPGQNRRKARESNPHDLAVSGLADRPGKPYPATLQGKKYAVLSTEYFLQWTAGELNPDSLGANQVSYQVGPAAHVGEVKLGVEPRLPPYQGGVPP
jgi:hypothetical protein